MNYRIAKTMLGLCVIYLVAFYILKFAFPEILIQAITHPTLLRLGEFLRIWRGFDYIIQLMTSFVTFYLFACASSGKFKYSLRQWITLCIIVIMCNLIFYLLPEIYTHTCISLMFVTALFLDGNLKYATISFSIHGFLSQFLLSIRGFETIMMYFNAVSGILINLEGFIWLILLSIIFHIKEKNNGTLSSPLCKQADKNA